jgi:Zn-dependent membrane protease YugP
MTIFMVMLYALAAIAFVALLLGPQLWVKAVIARHAGDRPDFPGTGGELARHLLDRAGLEAVGVEVTNLGDHYSPMDKTVRLSQAHHDGRSLTAVAIAAHEVSHALQDADGYRPLRLRTRLAGLTHRIEQIGSVLLIAAPVVGLISRAPQIMLLEIGAGLAILASTIVIHAVTLPVEFDASFDRALPILEHGEYLADHDLPAARSVLKAAAFTYVAAAFVSLLDVARWLRVLRF